MAKETAKRNMRRNASRMQNFTMVTWGVNIISLVFFIYYRGTIPYFLDFAAISFWATHEFISLQLLKHFAKPTISANGELLDCPDASDPQELGVYSLAQDVLWWCWAVQMLCTFFHWAFFVFYLPIPAMLFYKAWNSFLGPLVRSRFSASETDSTAGGSLPQSRLERRRQEIQRRKGKA